ncbi:MAG: UvrD-helicase domain-containing protein [Anaerolineae bacterium]|nr:UvrD-helicase domain-containing protein [Anaerolineae bacterium]
MPLTPDQHRAIHHHTDNLIVVAGAGSGKTYVLVERYLALLERNPGWSLNALVAITFTQKAAQEMRDRVRQHLQRRVDESADADAAPWASRLAAMDSARIDTIHSLCATILRANAAEAGVDPGFVVLDEVESAVLLDDAIDDTFRSLRPDDPALELFMEYGEQRVREEVARLARTGFELPPADHFTAWLDQWVTDARAHLERFGGWCAASEFANWSSGVPDGDRLAVIWATCVDLLARVHHGATIAERLAALYELKPAIDLRVGAAAAWGGKEALQKAKAALRALRETGGKCAEIIGDPPGEADQRAAVLMPLWSALVGQVRAAYRAARDERAALDFDDLEALTRDLLADDAVRARYLGAEFRHVLVDEFQDTNAAQWAIINRIADPAVPGCLFVVGDPKQSIYGFRGADVSVFNRVRDAIAVAAAPVALATSFRTHRRLVDCLNAVFDRVLSRDPASLVAEYEVEAGAMQAFRLEAPSDAPALELLLLDKSRLDADEEQAMRRWEARLIARRIRALVEDERRPIYDKRREIVRPVEYGDVALLFQAMTHVTRYEAALKAEGIPYQTTAGKGYYDRQEVWDLLNLLRALYNPADNLSLAAALRSPLFSLSDDALLALRLPGGSLWESLMRPEYLPADEAGRAAFARDVLRDLRRQAGRVTIAELLNDALEQTGYLAVLTGLPDGKRRRGNVEKLLEKAESSGRITLSAFTQYLVDMSASEAREGEAVLESEGAVQLMTVHKSKGLEFPVVVLVDASYHRNAGGSDLISGAGCKVYDAAQDKLVSTFAHRRAENLARLREEAEKKRLFYVAATRAQDCLIVSGQVTCRDDTPLATKGWLGWLLPALELSELAPQAQDVRYEWGSVRVDFPEPLGDADEIADAALDWDDIAFAAESPPLLGAVPGDAAAPARSLTATQIADLGSAAAATPSEARRFFAERWRRSVLHDAPARITLAGGASWAQVGEIVHQVVRRALPPDDASLRAVLRRCAWESGLVGADENYWAVENAFDLLRRIRRSDVFRVISQARQVYREVPFVYQSGERTIHGVIDLLLQNQSGQWIVVDYKTAWLEASVTEAMLREHVRRYHVQMGVYAAAVRELVGLAPIVYIYYIRYAMTVMIPEADWTDALVRLDGYIGDAIGYG